MATSFKTAVDFELARLGLGEYWETRVEGKRFIFIYSYSDTPWFSLPRSKWANCLTKLRAIAYLDNADDLTGEAFNGASAEWDWDGRR